MFQTLLRRELYDHLMSLRFWAALLLAIVCASLSTTFFSSNYLKQRRAFSESQSVFEDLINRFGNRAWLLSDYLVPDIQPPPRLSTVVYAFPRFDLLNDSFNRDPLAPLTTTMDLTFIVSVVFTLFAFVFTYDAICGEKERGTLRAVCSNAVRRNTIFLAKWVGSFLTLSLVLIISMLVSVIILSADPELELKREDWFALASIALVSLLLISVFITMGLLISIRSKTSGFAVLAVVFAWIVAVFIIPNMAPHVGAEVFRTPPYESVLRQIIVLEGEREREVEAAMAPFLQRGFAREQAEELAHVKEIRDRYGKQINEQFEAMLLKYGAQAGGSLLFAFLSPVPCYFYAATGLAGGGVGGGALAFFQRPYVRALQSYVSKRFEEEKKRNPALTDFDRLDLSGRPKPSYRELPLVGRAVIAGVPLAFLLLHQAIFFLWAFRAFKRCDVR